MCPVHSSYTVHRHSIQLGRLCDGLPCPLAANQDVLTVLDEAGVTPDQWLVPVGVLPIGIAMDEHGCFIALRPYLVASTSPAFCQHFASMSPCYPSSRDFRFHQGATPDRIYHLPCTTPLWACTNLRSLMLVRQHKHSRSSFSNLSSLRLDAESTQNKTKLTKTKSIHLSLPTSIVLATPNARPSTVATEATPSLSYLVNSHSHAKPSLCTPHLLHIPDSRHRQRCNPSFSPFLHLDDPLSQGTRSQLVCANQLGEMFHKFGIASSRLVIIKGNERASAINLNKTHPSQLRCVDF